MFCFSWTQKEERRDNISIVGVYKTLQAGISVGQGGLGYFFHKEGSAYRRFLLIQEPQVYQESVSYSEPSSLLLLLTQA